MSGASLADGLDSSFDDEAENLDNTFLAFHVGDEEYAVPVAYVVEIVRLPRSYTLPDMPSYIRGVINLRGKVIPLVDVRARFGLPLAEYTDRTVVVVLELGDTATGLIVDAVSEVAEIPPEQVDARAATSRGRRGMVRAMGKRAHGVSFILDVETLLEAESAHAAVAPLANAIV